MSENQNLMLEPKILGSLLLGLVKNRFTGTIQVDTGKGIKRLFYKDGQIVFASSNVIDDRLGEVMYRSGMISLDQMTDSAVKVNRTTKFGKVLLLSRLLSSVQLWRALKLQVVEIVRSIFLVPGVKVLIESGVMKAPTTIVFDRGSEHLLEECSGFGRMYRAFIEKVGDNCGLVVAPESLDSRGIQTGTFVADLLEMSKGTGTLKDVVEATKLQEITAYTAIFRLMNLGICRISGLQDGESVQMAGGANTIKSQIDAFGLLVRSIQDAFMNEGMIFPLPELQNFVSELNGVETPVFFLDDHGLLPKESIQNIYYWCQDSDHCTRQMSLHLESINHFLLQLTGDLLPSGKGQAIKTMFQEMI